MPGLRKNLCCCALLHHFTLTQYQNVIAQTAHQRQIVADENQRQAFFAAQGLQQRHNPRLRRHV